MKPDNGPKRRVDPKAYLRLSGIGLTMMAIILLFTFAGRWVDGLVGWRFPVFTLVLALAGIAGAILYLIKESAPKS